MDLKNNPFAKLFPSFDAALSYMTRVKEAGKTLFLDELEEPLEGKDLSINLIVEEVFNFTLCKNPPSFKRKSETQLLYLEDVSGTGKLGYDYIDSLELVLFERLLLEEPSKHVVHVSSKPCSTLKLHVMEKRCLCYLFECFQRLLYKRKEHKELEEIINKMIGYVIRNAATALKQPEVYEKQNLHQQILDLFPADQPDLAELTEFLTVIADDIDKEEGADVIFTAFSPVLSIVQERLEKCNILTYDTCLLSVLHVYASIPKLADVLIKQGNLKEPTTIGRAFAETPLGAAFNISILPKNPYLQFEFFDNPLQHHNIKALENQLFTATDGLMTCLESILKALLKSKRQETLTWLGSCLDKNMPRGRLSALNAFSLDTLSCVSDGFMTNLAIVLLRFTEPFATADNPKLLKIDPTYPAAKMTPDGANGVHMNSFNTDTCLIPAEDGQTRPCAESFSFITECFFMAHRALSLGMTVVQDKAQRLYREIGMLQARLGTNARSEEMELAMMKYLNLRCVLANPSTLAYQGKLIVATCSWLTQVLLDPDVREDRKSFNPTEAHKLTFPLPDFAPPTLRCVPEVLLENVYQYLVAVKRFEMAPDVLEKEGLKLLEPILTHLLVFMSGSVRARNPHLRAQLAECLDCIMPHDGTSSFGTFYREKLFKEHPHRLHIVESLLDLFVSIEMTGQSVTFEQKFNYRRPMYAVMEYLWSIEEQRQCFKKLAADAEANMEAVNPPLFLRFLNLLMNDAVFLLDEALNNMSSLRTMITARDAGEWESLPPDERQRSESSLVHVGMTARFDNILGTKTIECLVYLSSEIKSIFCHPTLVDRIAAMLNYFLLHLVGPNKKNFKVKDQLKEYSFDPAAIVLNICMIYIHLSESEEFCAAVSRDGRSYSPQLFSLAESVLVRIVGGAAYVTDLQTVAENVNRLAKLQKQEEELLADVPDEFLDPITSVLMSDPVLLPSSRQIVDRSTIARHLMNDQSDPFNREPLTMDKLKPATELKQQIDEWVAQRHNKAA